MNLLGAIDGLRPLLDRYGLSFGLTETTEVLGNPSGGLRQGAIVEGMTQMSLGADLSKTIGLDGGLFNISAFQIHGRGLSAANLGNLNIVSSIEAEPSTRLNELWYQQTFWTAARTSRSASRAPTSNSSPPNTRTFSSTPASDGRRFPAADLPSGGPAYPLATPGVRLRTRPTEAITTLVGVFSGSPAGLRPGDPQRLDASGTTFDVTDGAFVIGEVQPRHQQGQGRRGPSGHLQAGSLVRFEPLRGCLLSERHDGAATRRADRHSPVQARRLEHLRHARPARLSSQPRQRRRAWA